MSFVGDELEYDYPEEGKSVTHGESLKWTSLQSKHFIAALIPRGGAGGAEIRLLSKTDDLSDYAAIVPFARGKNVDADFDVYVGPKALAHLEKLKVNPRIPWTTDVLVHRQAAHVDSAVFPRVRGQLGGCHHPADDRGEDYLLPSHPRQHAANK